MFTFLRILSGLVCLSWDSVLLLSMVPERMTPTLSGVFNSESGCAGGLASTYSVGRHRAHHAHLFLPNPYFLPI